MEEPRLSIIIVSWNCRELILGCLSSLEASLGMPVDIIVVDNDSSDGSAVAVEDEYPSVRVIRNAKNLGFAGGVNTGLRVARTELILLLNPDARLQGGVIDRLVEHLDAHTEAGIVGPTILNADGSLQRSFFRFPTLTGLVLTASYLYKIFPDSAVFNRPFYGGQDPDEMASVDAVSGAAFLFRRKLIDEIGEFDEGYFMYAEEADLCFRARQAGWDVHYVPARAVIHVGGGSSRLQSKRMLLQMRRSLLRFFEKHRGSFKAACARVLLVLFLAARLPYWAWRRASASGEARQEAAVVIDNYLSCIRFLFFRGG